MFTGIIEEIGKVSKLNPNEITVECGIVLNTTKLGDSIAVNGVCLTVVKILSNGFVADISPTTLKSTTLGDLCIGDFVNLERAMKADGRFGGHLVSGHVDGRGKIIEIKKNGDFINVKIDLESSLTKYVINKGSICINGISLTIAEVNESIINVAVIPHTYENTNLKTLKNNSFVNIEVDMIAKYIEKFLSTGDNKSRISLEFLQEHGF